MSHPSTPEEDRGAKFIRLWRLLVLLRTGPQTLEQLAAALGVHARTVRRDLSVLQRVPFPITSRFETGSRQGIRVGDANVWALGDVSAWPPDSPVPIAEVSHVEGSDR